LSSTGFNNAFQSSNCLSFALNVCIILKSLTLNVASCVAGTDPGAGNTVSIRMIFPPAFRLGTRLLRMAFASEKGQSWIIMRRRKTSTEGRG